MTIHRITRIADIVRYWLFFTEGVAYEAKYLRYNHTMETYQRIIFHLVRHNPNAWVGMAFDDDLTKPVAFVLSHDVTPLFATEKEFEISMFYYKKGFKQAISQLQTHLDKFCREKGIVRYYLSTTSFCSTADKVFKDSWRQIVRSNTVFKRELKSK
jgi:hypothetical protein